MGHARRITRAALVLTALTAILAPCARADAARHDGSRPSGAELGDVATRGASTRGDVDALDAATCAARVDAATDSPPREANQSPPPPPSATAPRVATEFLDDRYIVRFRDYRMVGVHRASLERVLGPPRNAADLDANLYAHDDPPADPAPAVAPARWEWVERRNKAAKHPTDFAVVRLGGADDATTRAPSPSDSAPGASLTVTELDAITARIAAAPGVRDVRREQKLTRSLAWDESRPESESSAAGSRRFRAGSGSNPRADGRVGDSQDERHRRGVAPDVGLVWPDGGDDADAPNRATRRRRETSSSKSSGASASHGGGGGARPGRLRTRPTIGMEPIGWSRASNPGGYYDDDAEDAGGARRRLLRAQRPVVDALGAEALWKLGHSGAKVRTGVFDTGVRADHPHFRKVKERSNWTHEDTLSDGLGHGTFVAGVVASQDATCPGFAPDAEVHTFRVFTNDQVSYTSWFLDAFNYAMATEMHVINLSIGGPDYLDSPFVDKVNEITANGIIMVSAIGNDGPLYGTLNNPADNLDVIGVGGIDYKDAIAPFSSRGMSTHELPNGYGRVKPDVVAYGREVMGSRIQGGCRSLSGTSVASPVVAGAVTLLASVVPEERRWDVLNPASMKQALVEGATRLSGPMMYEQGAGKINLWRSYEILREYVPRASLVPGGADFTSNNCPYAWPHCAQPLYHGAMPFMFNATIVNGMGLVGWLEAAPEWRPSDDAVGDLGNHLDVRFAFSEMLWPWSGYLAMYVRVKSSGATISGRASGTVSFAVLSPPGRGETEPRRSVVEAPFAFEIAPTPPRERRVLWSQYHSLRYPPGYVPRDDLDVKADILDWHGDHPHTNFHAAYDALRSAGYFVEILGSPLTCFDASNYGALLLVDAEEEYSEAEIAKLESDVKKKGLGVAVFAEWYNVAQMESMRFFDDNTHSYWTPVTGGANVPALNDLLRPFGFAFGDRVLSGTAMPRRGKPVVIKSGANIARAPAGAFLHKARLQDKSKDLSKRERRAEHAFAAFYQTDGGGVLGGRLALFGDSNCLDSSHTPGECFDFLVSTLKYLTEHDRGAGATDDEKHVAEAYDCGDPEPTRRRDADMASLSTTLGGRPGNEGRAACGPNDPLEFHERPEEVAYNAPAWSARRARATIESRPAGWRETFARGAADLERGLEEGLGEILPRNDARIPEDDDEYGDASSPRAETGARTVADRRRGTVADRRRESPSTTDANVPSTIGGGDERAGERPGGFRLDQGKATGWMSAGGAATVLLYAAARRSRRRRVKTGDGAGSKVVSRKKRTSATTARLLTRRNAL